MIEDDKKPLWHGVDMGKIPILSLPTVSPLLAKQQMIGRAVRPITASNVTIQKSEPLNLTREILDELKQSMREIVPRPRFQSIPLPTKQRRTHRRKRVNKKWRKKYGTIPYIPRGLDITRIYEFAHTPGVFFAYEPTYLKILREFRERGWHHG